MSPQPANPRDSSVPSRASQPVWPAWLLALAGALLAWWLPVGTSGAVTGWMLAVALLPLAALPWLAWRGGLAQALLALMGVLLVWAVGAAFEHGPFALRALQGMGAYGVAWPSTWCLLALTAALLGWRAAGPPTPAAAAEATDAAASAGDDGQRQLSSRLFMNLHEGLLIADPQRRVLDANPACARILGVERALLLGTVPELLRTDLDELPAPERWQREGMWAGLRAGGHWVGDLIEQRADGEPQTLHVTLSTVHDPEGAVLYHLLVVTDTTELQRQREQIARHAHSDELTRLPNRARLSELLASAMRAADRDGHLLAVCCIDLDHFKDIDLRFGRASADQLLAELASRLRAALRSRGPARQDIAARLGGDEFALLLHVGTAEEAGAAVQRVLGLVARPFQLGQASDAPLTQVTASIGVTLYPEDNSDPDRLLRHADHAMYSAKQAGRNRMMLFDADHRRRDEERVTAVARVQTALEQGELVLHYQPKVDLRHGKVLGLEALLRWHHPERGLLAPVHFLPVVEHTELSARVGDHVLALALDQLEQWHAQGLPLSVSVNISARHLQASDFVPRLTELLGRHASALGPHLELEMLETAALVDFDLTASLLQQCARLGVRWALDDFGTAYSSLTYLKRLPVQVLKIDRSFVQNMLIDPHDEAIVQGVIGLAGTFGCTAVAEGVESAAQAHRLLELGCEIGQGVGIAAPMPAAEVPGWVRGWGGLPGPSAAGTAKASILNAALNVAPAPTLPPARKPG